MSGTIVEQVSTAKYPAVYVQLMGKNGNILLILGRRQHALSTAGDYSHLLATCMCQFDCY